MNVLNRIFLIVSALSLSACSYIYSEDGLFKDTTYSYVKAKQSKNLVLPKDLTQLNKLDYFAVPTIGKKAKAGLVGKEIDLMAPVQILDVLDTVRISRLSEIPAVYITDEKEFVLNAVK